MAFPFTFGSSKNNKDDAKDYFSTAFFTAKPYSNVTEDEALQIPAVKAAVQLISNSIGSLPVYLYVEDETNDSLKKVKDQRINVLNHESNRFDSAQSIKKKVVQDYLLHGKAYLYKKDGQLHHLKAEYMKETPYTKDGGATYETIEYVYNHVSSKTLNESEVIVIDSSSNGLLVDGEKTLNQAIGQMDYSGSLLANSAVPSGILKAASRLTADAIERLKNSWSNRYKGTNNAGATVVLEEGLDYQALALKPDEMQLTESHKIVVSEIARLLNVPESLINSSANKYGSLEQNSIQYLQGTILPIVTAIESALDKHLLNSIEKELGYFFRFSTDEILRTTEAEKIETVLKAYVGGLISINEARYKLDYSKLSSDYTVLNQGQVLRDEDGNLTVLNLGQEINNGGRKIIENNGTEK
ncbi:phage portal protein [Metabacillus indicus]|uniref:phage portal protein n=1 Tax=Metabacillus indicus TaxID=246786 RepID=UPI0006912918|nr:phage portal protein [Metabacillus indicus]